MNFLERAGTLLKNDNKESRNFQKSIGINLILKPVAMLISLIYTPILLRYLGTEAYGVWATILSVVNWIYSFDVGIGNGLRNILSTEVARKDRIAARKSVSTAYISLSIIVFAIYFFAIFGGSQVNWKNTFNTELEVSLPVFVAFTFVCINFILSLQNSIFYAVQRSEYVAISGVIVQCVNLASVYVAANLNSTGNKLIHIAFITGLSGFVIYVVLTIVLWIKEPYLKPSIKQFEKRKLDGICSLGIKFFLIQIAGIVLFTTDSIIIARLFDSSTVTSYNMVYKVFGLVMGVFSAMLTPIWSRFTVAKEQDDYDWMKKTIKRMKIIWGAFSIGLVIMVPIYKPLTTLWLGKVLIYDKGLIVGMAIYYIVYMYSGIYSTALNGLGNVNVQLVCAVFSAVINIPLSIFLARGCSLGTTGVCLGTVVSLIVGDIIFTIQMNNILNRKEKT